MYILLILSILPDLLQACTDQFKLSLQKFLFQSVKLPNDLDVANCPNTANPGSVVAAIVNGADARTLVPLMKISEAYVDGWPLGALLLALGHDREAQGGVLAPVDAVSVLVSHSMGVCEKVYGIFSLAATQLPVLSEDISGFVETSENLMRSGGLSLIDCPIALRALAKLEAANFFARVDANEFYTTQDERVQQYALHQVPEGPFGECLGGQKPPCGFFRGLELNLDYWTRRGVQLDDVDFAFKPVTDLKLVRITKVGSILEISVPTTGHYFGRYDDELRCITDFLKTVDKKFGIPDVEFVLNHGDLPLSRRVQNKPPLYDFSDGAVRAPVPLFSLVASPHFHDMLFPNVCRPKIGNLTHAAPDLENWDAKTPSAFYRGTDRGAVNWRDLNTPISELKSLRQVYLEALHGKEDFVDFALLEDDLFNATVVFSDPKFVPFEQSQKWKYILDIPGNGYSGSLKQKLTSSSAVFIVSKPEKFPEHLPVTEHFYFGLQAFKHYVPVESPDDLIAKISWARANDNKVKQIRDNANQYMETFRENSECYVWLLLSAYAQALQFEPMLTRTLKGSKHYQVTLSETVDRDENVRKCLDAVGYI